MTTENPALADTVDEQHPLPPAANVRRVRVSGWQLFRNNQRRLFSVPYRAIQGSYSHIDFQLVTYPADTVDPSIRDDKEVRSGGAEHMILPGEIELLPEDFVAHPEILLPVRLLGAASQKPIAITTLQIGPERVPDTAWVRLLTGLPNHEAETLTKECGCVHLWASYKDRPVWAQCLMLTMYLRNQEQRLSRALHRLLDSYLAVPLPE